MLRRLLLLACFALLLRPVAAQPVDPNELFKAGQMFDTGQGTEQNHALALRYYLQAAELGHVQAQVTAAEFLTRGTGGDVDLAGALQWYRRAADQGHVGAMYQLGLIYDAGKGVPQDFAEAARWFRRAAEHGDANAWFRLGQAFASGRGVEADVVAAHGWFTLAADAMTGEEGKAAAAARDRVASQMTPAQIALAEVWAHACTTSRFANCP